MNGGHAARVTIVNFNAPELHQLADVLTREGMLLANCRLYANKGRPWEQIVERTPLLGTHFNSTFGRRRIADPRLAQLTHEMAVLEDFAAAAVARAGAFPDDLRASWTLGLRARMRAKVRSRSASYCAGATHVVAYPGCALPSFTTAATGAGIPILSYPIAHHRFHRKMRQEEAQLQPQFAASWEGTEDESPAHFDILDSECAAARRILVGSSFVRDTFVSEGVNAAAMEVIPYGVDTTLFQAVTRERADPGFNVLFVGQISQRKGISYLLEAYRAFQRPGTQLTLVGRHVGSPDLWKTYRDSHAHKPNMPRWQLAEEYRRAHVFAFPTLLEGMPLVVLEAMASGLPVIVTPNGCSDIVRDGIDGFVVPIRDPQAVRQKLEYLYQHPEHRRQMGESARKRAQEFTWSRYTGAVMKLLESLGT